jgi:chromatin remodeling complex protein RSC6
VADFPNWETETLTGVLSQLEAVMGGDDAKFKELTPAINRELTQILLKVTKQTMYEPVKVKVGKKFQSRLARDSPVEEKPEKPKKAKAKRGTKRAKPVSGKGNGLQQPCPISDELAHFLGMPSGSTAILTEVTRSMNKYVKEHGLQDPRDGRVILCDEELQNLLGTDTMTYFTLMKYLSPHLLKSPAAKRAKKVAVELAATAVASPVSPPRHSK